MKPQIRRLIRFNAALFTVYTLTGIADAQMAKPNVYDTPPVLIHQESLPSIQQEIVQSKKDVTPDAGLVQLIVDPHGLPSHVMVMQKAGSMPDEQVVIAIRHDRFKPASKDGNPVPATIFLKVTPDTAK
jgi:hypothetical protein